MFTVGHRRERLCPMRLFGPILLTAMTLVGRVALVTGSGRNIGRAIALALADAGADVVINARANRQEAEKVAEEARLKGVKAIACLADVSDQKAVQAMVDAAHRDLGPVDILVNNAAVRPSAPFEKMTLQEWRDVIAGILDAAYICSNAVIGDMLTSGLGTIINISGQTGQEGSIQRAHVVAAKAGLMGFTKALAREYATRGITVNAVSPGSIDTAGSNSMHAGRRVIPMERRGRPAEIASICCYLASDEARYITGQTISVNGGSYMP